MRAVVRVACWISAVAGLLWLAGLLLPFGEAAQAWLEAAIEVSEAKIILRLDGCTVVLNRAVLDLIGEKLSMICTIPSLLGDALREIVAVVSRALTQIYR